MARPQHARCVDGVQREDMRAVDARRRVSYQRCERAEKRIAPE
jgi:hypothetical protein